MMTEAYYSEDSLEDDNRVGVLIRHCGVLTTQIAARRVQSYAVSSTQWAILTRLSAARHLSPTDLSAHLGYDMAALTRVVDGLVRRAAQRRGPTRGSYHRQ